MMFSSPSLRHASIPFMRQRSFVFDTEFNGCLIYPCLNGGSCHPESNVNTSKCRTCTCKKGFFGDKCERKLTHVLNCHLF